MFEYTNSKMIAYAKLTRIRRFYRGMERKEHSKAIETGDVDYLSESEEDSPLECGVDPALDGPQVGDVLPNCLSPKAAGPVGVILSLMITMWMMSTTRTCCFYLTLWMGMA